MLGRTLFTTVLRQSSAMWRQNVAVMKQPAFQVPRRSWAQVGHIVVTPPRVKVSGAEQMAHAAVMLTVWLTPIAWFMTQLKVWRRAYVET